MKPRNKKKNTKSIIYKNNIINFNVDGSFTINKKFVSKTSKAKIILIKTFCDENFNM